MLLSALALSKRKSKGPANFLLVYLLAIGCLAEVACGGSGNSSGGGGGGSAGTPAGTYTITVTGTAGSTQHTTTVTLTIQ